METAKPSARELAGREAAAQDGTPPAAGPEPALHPGAFTLEVGEYPSRSALEEAKKKVESAGLVPVVEPGTKLKRSMTRLVVGTYASQPAAKKEIQRLQQAGVEAFFLREADQKFHVYAGSYADEQGAQKEQKRLASQGIPVATKQVSVGVPTFRLIVAGFQSRASAKAAVRELEKRGLKPALLEGGAAHPQP